MSNANNETTVFRDALAKGMGRAVRYVRESSAETVREDLLDACIHCRTYDAQCEGHRADWLFNMIELTGEPEFYRAKILKTIPTVRDTDSYDFWQLYYLLKEFAIRGDAECRTALYHEFDLLVDDNNIGGADALVEIDGIPGLLHVLEIAGRRIHNGDDTWWEVSYHLEEAEEKFGQDTVHNAINAEASRNEFVRVYCEQAEHATCRNGFGISVVDERITDVLSKVTPPVDTEHQPVDEWIAAILEDDFDDNAIRNATDDMNILAVLSSRHPFYKPGRCSLSNEVIETIWSALMNENNPYRLFCLLNVFTPFLKNRLPRFVPKMLAWIDSPYPLSWKATQALAYLSDESIRLKALELLQAVPEKRNWYNGFELILSSFRPEDENVIASAILTHQFPDEHYLHGVGMDIIKLAETYPNVAFREPLLWFYEHTPCSCCRCYIVEELNKRQLVPKEIWAECRNDCNDTLWELAQSALP